MSMLRRKDFADMFFVSAYGPKLVDVVVDATERFGPGAKQSFKEECDINNIMAKYQRTGALSWLAKYDGQYGDFSAFDFMDAQLTVAKAKEMFGALPSSVRKRFQNDPAEFLDFMSRTENAEEAIKLGLATAKPTPVETAVPPAAGTPT